MTEAPYERALGFMAAHEDAIAERVEPFRWGRALFNERLPKMYDLNFLRVERFERFTAQELAAEADRVQATLAHRRVDVRAEEAARSVEAGFRDLGWDAERHVLMAHARDPERSALDVQVEEVGEDQLAPVRKRVLAVEPWATPEVVAQRLEAEHLLDRGMRVRRFAARAEGALVSYCELYSDDRSGQIEDVATVPEFRNRGFATALVLHALAESRRLGHDFTFLVADAEDWSKELYARLGFDVVGQKTRFVRRSPGDPGPRRDTLATRRDWRNDWRNAVRGYLRASASARSRRSHSRQSGFPPSPDSRCSGSISPPYMHSVLSW